MTVADFDNEQNYFIGKIQLNNKYISGSGIVYGCEVKKIQREDDMNWRVGLSQGYAMDCCGREIISSENNIEYIVKLVEPIDFDGPRKVGLWAIRKDVLKSPVPSPANNSTCDEICSYSRIEEKFTLKFDYVPNNEDKPVEVFFNKGLYRIGDAVDITLRDRSSGNVTEVEVLVKSNADPNGFFVKLKKVDNQTQDFKGSLTLTEDPLSSNNVKLAVNSSRGDDIVLEYKGIKIYGLLLSGNLELDQKRVSNNYYRNQLRKWPDCDMDTSGAKILLAIVDKKNESIIVDENETSLYRSIVGNNMMLHDMLGKHLLDHDNHHEVPSERVDALKTINNIGNTSNGPPVPNIDLISLDGTINITPEGSKKRILLSSNVLGQKNFIRSRSIVIPINPRTYTITPEQSHHFKTDLGDLDPIPLVVLAKENEDGKIVQYTEDLGFLLSFTLQRPAGNPNLRVTPQTAVDRGLADGLGIREILENPDSPFENRPLPIFKPVNITKKTFQILVINYSQTPMQLRLRAWSIPAEEPDV